MNNWYRLSQLESPKGTGYVSEQLINLRRKLEQKYQGLDLFVSEDEYRVFLDSIVIPLEQRNRGIGTKVISELQNYARMVNKPLVLSPEAERGKKKMLERFYKNLGFRHNRGRNRNYQLSTPFAPTMYWNPK
jgi:GNAT superfamily N-acetyltransferase